MNKTIAIMPMAGEGQRFKDTGYTVPKPLIKFNEKYLFEHSLDILKGLKVDILLYIIRAEHEYKYFISKTLEDISSKLVCDPFIIAVDKTTRGAAETVKFGIDYLISQGLVDDDDKLIIMDCDVCVEAKQWKTFVKNPTSDGVLLTFNSKDPKYSYAGIKDGKVISVVEKNPISDYAVTSPYFISRIGNFTKAFNEMDSFISNNQKTYKEMYMSVLFDFLITDGFNITNIDVDKLVTLGTPEEIAKAKEND